MSNRCNVACVYYSVEDFSYARLLSCVKHLTTRQRWSMIWLTPVYVRFHKSLVYLRFSHNLPWSSVTDTVCTKRYSSMYIWYDMIAPTISCSNVTTCMVLCACMIVHLYACHISESYPGADNLDSGFQPSGVGKMSISQYVDGWPLQKTAELQRAAVRWPRVAFATTRGSLAVSAGAVAVTVSFKALNKCSSSTFLTG